MSDTTGTSPKKRKYAKPIISIIATIIIAIIIIIVLLDVVFPAVQQAVQQALSPGPLNFTFLSETTNRQTVGGFLGIGGTVVVWVDATIQNTGNAAAGCTVYARVIDANSGSYWMQSQGVYLGAGQSQALQFEFNPGPGNDAYRWSVTTYNPGAP